MNLSYNLISTLKEDNALKPLKNLEILKLNNNGLVNISSNAFVSLNLVDVLDLSNNFLTSSIFDELFNGLVSLIDLNMNNNQIISIKNPLTFSVLKKLVFLRLKNNKIVSLNNEIVGGLDLLQGVFLENNPIAFYLHDHLKLLCSNNTLCVVHY